MHARRVSGALQSRGLPFFWCLCAIKSGSARVCTQLYCDIYPRQAASISSAMRKWRLFCNLPLPAFAHLAARASETASRSQRIAVLSTNTLNKAAVSFLPGSWLIACHWQVVAAELGTALRHLRDQDRLARA